jgi:signal transduction histidine kinase
MRATGWLRSSGVEVGWGAFALVNLAAMVAWPRWETVPFHFVWISLTLVYGFRVWAPRLTWVVLLGVIVATGASICADAFNGLQLWGELFEVPLMSAMFLAMVWHARRRMEAVRVAEEIGEQRACLLERQEAFLHDVSHELRTPVTIARGHLQLMSWERPDAPELRVALDELDRIDDIIDRLLLLAQAEQPDFVQASDVELEPFLADVFLRWSGIAPRTWKLDVARDTGCVHADPSALRKALDALLENAVKYSEPHTPITLRAYRAGGETVVEVTDAGCGIEPDAIDRVFQRFARADDSRTRALGGVGLGLAIVDAIVRAHGGRCTVASSGHGSTFALRLPVDAGRRAEAAPPSMVDAAPALVGLS